MLWQRWPLSGAGSCVSLGMSLHCSELSCSAKVCCWTVISTQSWSHHVLSHFLKVLLPRAAFLSSGMLMESPRMAPSFLRAALPPPSPYPPLCHCPLPCSCPLRPRQTWGRRAFPVSILTTAVLQDPGREGLQCLHKQSVSFIAFVACFSPPELTVVPLIALLPQVSPMAVLI